MLDNLQIGSVRPDAFPSDLRVKQFWRYIVIINFMLFFLHKKVTERKRTLI